MNIVIVDSGSTKSTWAFVKDGVELEQVEIAGINPLFITFEQLKELLNENIVELVKKHDTQRLYFYGAGCVDNAVKEQLSGYFEQILGIDAEVDNDIIGAARAVLGDENGIVCIMGTGSACALYQNGQIVKSTPSGGFILGDEGSGGALGRILIADFIKNQLPQRVRDEINKEGELTYAEVVRRVYKEPMPNRWLAQWAEVLYRCREEEYVQNLLNQQFTAFVERNLLPLNPTKETKIGFVGSIAYFFEDELRAAFAKYDLSITTILRRPMDGLVKKI